jgi:serine/threonine protein kinase
MQEEPPQIDGWTTDAHPHHQRPVPPSPSSPTTDFASDTGHTTRRVRAPGPRIGALLGRELAGVRVQRCLATSSMSDVYVGVDLRSGQQRVVKACREEFDRERGRSRFRREIALHSKVSSPHVPRIYAAGRLDGIRFLVMEHVPGHDLTAVLKQHADAERPLAIATLVRMAIDIAAGLQAIADAGIVHRDIKPANILTDEAGHAKIIDFGIATTVPDEHFTEENHVLGTIGYMSPEQWTGTGVDQRSDIYAFGIVLLEMATGLLPTQRSDLDCAIQPDFQYQPAMLRSLRPDIPQRLESIIAQCLRRDRRLRYHSFASILRDLHRLQADLQGRATSRLCPIPLQPVVRRLPEIVIITLLVCAILAYALL